MKKSSTKTLLLVASITMIILAILGCATLFKGSNEKVNFGSSPSSASVYINGLLMGTTPFEINLQSSKTYSIEFRKEGYQSRTVMINNSIGVGWLILDILPGLIPIIVDAATGNWMYLDQTNVNAALEKQR